MRTTIGTIGATLAVMVALVAGAALPFDPASRFDVKIDNTGDGYEDVAFRLPGGTKSFVGPADDAFFVDL